MLFVLFFLGLALGSFLHVIASRYNEERFILTAETVGGRSYCPSCKKTLAWYELIPLVSFIVQKRRCRACGVKIGWSYFFVELLSALIVVCVSAGLPPAQAILWTLVFLILLLMSLIDIRLQMIPDELVLALGAIALALIFIAKPVGGYADNFIAAFSASLFFLLLIAITKGKGMGFGDAKLIFVLGLLFGSMQTLLLVMLAFVIGAAWGVSLIFAGTKKLKSALPFGPFLAFASVLVFFFGQNIIDGYLRLLGL